MEVIENQGGISMSNNSLSYFNGGKKSAYCPEVESYAKAHGRFVDKKSGKKGDVALFDFGKGRASHSRCLTCGTDRDRSHQSRP
jgi:hypothetical protein